MKLYIPLHEFLLFHFNFCYNLIKKSLLERVISCEKSTNWFQILKFSKGQKILKNQKIHYLEIFETKYIYIYIYDYTIEKYKRKIDYLQKNI